MQNSDVKGKFSLLHLERANKTFNNPKKRAAGCLLQIKNRIKHNGDSK